MIEQKFNVFFAIIFSALLINARRAPGEIGVTDYMIRVTNITECPGAARPHDMDVKINNYHFKHHITLRVYLPEDYTLTRLLFRMIRCREDGYACENFQAWNFTNFCHWFRMKNQIWSEMVEKIRPTAWRYTCPTFLKKGNYSVTNLTVNAEQYLKYYPDIYKYFWRLITEAYTPSETMIGCIRGSGYMLKYTRRRIY